MLVVDLKEMYQCYTTLKQYKSIIQRDRDQLLGVRSRLKTISEMEIVEEQIRKILHQLEEEMLGIHQEMLVLKKAIESYEKCERRIKDAYEESVIRHKKSKVGYTELKTLGNMLTELKLK